MPEFAIWDLFSTVVRVAPDRPAVLTRDGGVTFGELADRVERVASFLTARRVRLGRRGRRAAARGGAAADRDHGLGLRAAASRSCTAATARAPCPSTSTSGTGVESSAALLADARPVALFVAEDLVALVQQAVADLDADVRAPEIIALGGDESAGARHALPRRARTPAGRTCRHPRPRTGTCSTPEAPPAPRRARSGDRVTSPSPSLGAAQDNLAGVRQPRTLRPRRRRARTAAPPERRTVDARTRAVELPAQPESGPDGRAAPVHRARSGPTRSSRPAPTSGSTAWSSPATPSRCRSSSTCRVLVRNCRT